jgi:hypothetical protein
MGGTGITLNHHSPAGRPRTRLSSARPPCQTMTSAWLTAVDKHKWLAAIAAATRAAVQEA